ncbi:MAG: DUF6046 domain-containing protein [Dysgonamonadaceae bacterium]|jgi:hypothetical protein|nr:DUF6046 domain-containing protein [Dysgonamonadaceae bacterium]
MTALNFRFSAAGLGYVMKSAVYPLVPVAERKQPAGDEFRADGVRLPLVGTMNGKKVIVPLVIKSESGEQINFDEAVVSVQKNREIICTQLVGGRGTVKEYVSDGDMDLTITAAVVAVDEDGYMIDDYPYEALKEIVTVLDSPERLYIVSDFLKVFDLDGGDYGIVIESYTVRQETHTNRQVLTINAVSDYDYTIYSED